MESQILLYDCVLPVLVAYYFFSALGCGQILYYWLDVRDWVNLTIAAALWPIVLCLLGCQTVQMIIYQRGK